MTTAVCSLVDQCLSMQSAAIFRANKITFAQRRHMLERSLAQPPRRCGVNKNDSIRRRSAYFRCLRAGSRVRRGCSNVVSTLPRWDHDRLCTAPTCPGVRKIETSTPSKTLRTSMRDVYFRNIGGQSLFSGLDFGLYYYCCAAVLSLKKQTNRRVFCLFLALVLLPWLPCSWRGWRSRRWTRG